MRKAALLATALLSSAASAETLVDNVNGITLNAAGGIDRFSAIVIGNDGRIKQVLKRGEKRPTKVDYRIDGGGKTMLPGLIDAHGHVMGTGWQALSLDLSDATSLADALARVKAYAAANPNRRWIIGRGWNQERWGLGRFPTAQELDSALADRPVWLERVDGHAGWANSAAMGAAGVNSATTAPSGGKIEMAAGKPSGIFVDAATVLVEKAVPQPIGKERDNAFLKSQTNLLAQGLTGIADMGTSVEDWMTFRRAGDLGNLRLRIYSYSAGLEPALTIAGSEPTPWLYGSRLKMGGIKLYSDGALGSRGAWLKQPYADKPSERGLQFLGDTKLNNMLSNAAFNGFQVAVHAIGDAANAQVISAIEEMNITYKGDRRWRLEHAQVVDPADFDRMAKAGIIASMQPVHQTSDRLMAEARLGPSRLKGAYAWNSLVARKIRMAFGSDTPVERPNPFVGMSVAISREDEKGEPFGGWQPQERISRERALAGYTTEAAFASFAETKVGMLSPGLFADFVLVDRDPLLATPAELRQTKVLETWIGGQREYRAPTPAPAQR